MGVAAVLVLDADLRRGHALDLVAALAERALPHLCQLGGELGRGVDEQFPERSVAANLLELGGRHRRRAAQRHHRAELPPRALDERPGPRRVLEEPEVGDAQRALADHVAGVVDRPRFDGPLLQLLVLDDVHIERRHRRGPRSLHRVDRLGQEQRQARIVGRSLDEAGGAPATAGVDDGDEAEQGQAAGDDERHRSGRPSASSRATAPSGRAARWRRPCRTRASRSGRRRGTRHGPAPAASLSCARTPVVWRSRPALIDPKITIR